MKQLFVNYKNTQYEFRFLELSRVIEIFKAGRYTYSMKCTASLFICNCPGSFYHRKCWHSEMIAEVMNTQEITEPWIDWAEEAGIEMYRKEVRNYERYKSYANVSGSSSYV